MRSKYTLLLDGVPGKLILLLVPALDRLNLAGWSMNLPYTLNNFLIF